MPDPIQVGLPVTLGQVAAEGERWRLFKLEDTATRRLGIVRLDLDEPYNSATSIPLNPGSGPVDEEKNGLYAWWSEQSRGITYHDVQLGLYMPYPSPSPILLSEAPVNQVPYLLVWREHLARIANDLKSAEWANHFHMREDPLAFNPASVSLTHEQEIRLENTVYVVRNLVGAVGQKLDEWADIDPGPSEQHMANRGRAAPRPGWPPLFVLFRAWLG